MSGAPAVNWQCRSCGTSLHLRDTLWRDLDGDAYSCTRGGVDAISEQYTAAGLGRSADHSTRHPHIPTSDWVHPSLRKG